MKKVFLKLLISGLALLTMSVTAFANCNTQGRKSPGSNAPTQFTVINQVGDRSAKLYWIDFNGQPVLYATIPPNGRHTQQTYRGHLWTSVNSFGYCDTIFEAHNNLEVVIK